MRIASGVRPTDRLHLGHFFGAIRDHVESQSRGEGLYFIADYHALTLDVDPAGLSRRVLDTATAYLACGLDPSQACLYRQSDVPEVCELFWLLTCLTPMGLLERAVAYKEYRASSESFEAGVFNYPTLMAADVLLTRADVVLVGRDQLQNVEITRDIAKKFNRLAPDDPVFALPEARLSRAPFVPGLDGEKMSSRTRGGDNVIPLFAAPDELSDRVNRIVTDSRAAGEPKDPETCTVFGLYRLVASDEEQAELAARYEDGRATYGEAKARLAERLDAYLAPYREAFEAWRARPDDVQDILQSGAKAVRGIAADTLARARAAVGLT